MNEKDYIKAKLLMDVQSRFKEPRIENPTSHKIRLSLPKLLIDFITETGHLFLDAFFTCLQERGGLQQTFLCHVPISDIDLLPESMFQAQKVWVACLCLDSCIIKANVFRVLKGKKLQSVYPALKRNEYWADVINIHTGSVSYNKTLLLKKDLDTGLYRPIQPLAYEQTTNFSILYINHEGECIWSFPGGFAIEFHIPTYTNHVQFLCSRFANPAAIFK